jgi:hypothetical protein|tara:strand:+ start:540 stop:1007 length:468 start_codon:yes stop_codon:yes gene_type:complete
VAVESKDIEKWIGQVVAKKHKESGATICPFAKKTLTDRKIQIAVAKEDVLSQVNHCCSLFNIFNLDIVILYFNHKITEKQLSNLCKKAHKKNNRFAILYDHPDNKGKHKGVSFSFQKAPLLFIQDLNKLKDAQSRLQKTTYYRDWGLTVDSDMFY